MELTITILTNMPINFINSFIIDYSLTVMPEIFFTGCQFKV